MAKWPSFEQFQGLSSDLDKLKTKVTTLSTSQTGSGALPVPFIPERDSVGYIPLSGEEQTTITGNVLLFRWKHYAVIPAGLYIESEMSPDDIEYMEIYGSYVGPADHSKRFGAEVSTLTKRRGGYLDFAETIPTLSEGYIAVHFKAAVTLSGTPAPTLPKGVSVEMQDSEGNTVSGVPTTMLTVLRESEVVIRQQYVAPNGNALHSDHLEVIWPEGGQPTLLMVGADGSTFYQTMTPGLPQ